ncbi:MAG: MFS transporter [Candidatus Micrarchaeia archaeon]
MGLLSGIQKNVVVLGIVSFFTDVSSEMILPIIPIFLTTVLGVGKEIVGLIEGIADSASSLLDIFVGYFSDKSGNRKKFVFAGYGLSSVSKLGIALANTWPVFLVFRGVERVGKSIRTAPRDAIIAASSDKSVRGKAFGLHRAMDTMGAIIGPAIAYLILGALGSGEGAYKTIFYYALIPAFLSVLVFWLFVKEPKVKAIAKEDISKRPNFWESLRLLSSGYKRFLGISCLFSLAYFSFAFLILRANEIGIDMQNILLIYIFYNIVYVIFSVPIGQLSDKIGKRNVIIGSFFLYGLIVIGFAFASSFWDVVLLFAIYAIFVAADESVSKAYISDITGDKERGIALGAYNTAVGAVYLPASVIFGALWAVFGAVPAFAVAAAIAAVAGVGMIVYAKE